MTNITAAEEIQFLRAQLAGKPTPVDVHRALCLIYERGRNDGAEEALTQATEQRES